MIRRQSRYLSRVGGYSKKAVQPERAYNEHPDGMHVMSRNPDGTALSYYKSEVWDFRSYRPAGYTGSVSIDFSYLPKSMVVDAKWIMFMIIYYTSGNRIKPSTLRTYFKGIRSICRFAESTHQEFTDIYSNESLFKSYLKTKPAKSTLCAVQAILQHLLEIGPKISGIIGVNERLISLTRMAIKKAAEI